MPKRRNNRQKRKKGEKSPNPSFILAGVVLVSLALVFHSRHQNTPLKPPIQASKVTASTPPPAISEQGSDLLAPSESLFAKSLLVSPRAKGVASILMYHYVGTPPDPLKDKEGYNLTTTPQTLEKQVSLMEKLGYHPISMDQLAQGNFDRQSVVMTFDDGYEDFYTQVYPILKKHHWTATIYVISGKIGGTYMTWSQLRELHQNGFEIGAHTVHHPDLSLLSEEQQQQEIFQSKATIEKNIGAPVTTFAYPSGRYNFTTLKLIKAAGLTSAVTTHPGKVTPLASMYELPRHRVNPQLTLSTLKDELEK